jgi:nucleoside-diphosphate-sugar epimerase
MNPSILITGTNGFLGLSLFEKIISQGFNVKGSTRTDCSLIAGAQTFVMGELNDANDWQAALKAIDVVVHLAARVHVMRDEAADPLAEFRRVNVEGTLNLARQADKAGVRRFVFISSIGVNGAETYNHPFTEVAEVAPHSPYAISKYEAEIGLRQLAEKTGLEVVIIRPPLVYGPFAPGNFGSLAHWLLRGLPLPLGSVDNRRSFVALDNLVDFIITCINHPAAANQTFLVSDGEDLSTTELLQRMGRALGKPARLIPLPVELMTFAANLLGKGAVAQRLFGSLQVDSSKARDLLGWKPVVTVDEALHKTADAYKALHKK